MPSRPDRLPARRSSSSPPTRRRSSPAALLERATGEMDAWPTAWRIETDDVVIGQAIVAQLKPFIRHLHERGLAPRTIRRHLEWLAVLGSELISRRHDGVHDRTVPPVADAIDEEGGPLLRSRNEGWQREFDSTCRALSRFLTEAR